MKGDTMKINILDYEGKAKEVEIEDFENVRCVYITVLSGDEILTIMYDDNTMVRFDSSDCRIYSYFDDEYCIYDCNKTENIIYDPKFLNRKTSYDYA